MSVSYATMKQAMEAALFAEPNDEATHRAYADWLQEHGDASDQARGEFIRVQLALEDDTLAPSQRESLGRREQQLLDAHQREWLGELAPFLLEGEIPAWQAAQQGFSSFPVFATTRPSWLPEQLADRYGGYLTEGEFE